MTDYSAWSHHDSSHIIIGSIDGAKTNYPIPIIIPYESQMQTDYRDIRFSLADGTNLEYDLIGHNSTSAKFYVLIPSLPASPTTTPIIVHSGNSTVSDASNPSLVYLFYDNFNNLDNAFVAQYTTTSQQQQAIQQANVNKQISTASGDWIPGVPNILTVGIGGALALITISALTK